MEVRNSSKQIRTQNLSKIVGFFILKKDCLGLGQCMRPTYSSYFFLLFSIISFFLLFETQVKLPNFVRDRIPNFWNFAKIFLVSNSNQVFFSLKKLVCRCSKLLNHFQEVQKVHIHTCKDFLHFIQYAVQGVTHFHFSLFKSLN